MHGIKTDGTLWAWGNNASLAFAPLGLNSIVLQSSPVQVGALTDWSNSYNRIASYTMVSGNKEASVSAIKTTGTLWSWGRNQQGQLGLGDTLARSSPTQVGALTTWNSTVTGAAVKTDGTLWTWGYNVQGQLGLGNTLNYWSPVQVGALTNWSTTLVGNANGAYWAIKTDGTLWTWGLNGTPGGLGLGDTLNRSSPTQVGALTTWAALAANTSMTLNGTNGIGVVLASKTDGTLWAWGGTVAAGTFGSLGQGDTLNRSSPTQVGALTTWPTVGNKLAISLQSNWSASLVIRSTTDSS